MAKRPSAEQVAANIERARQLGAEFLVADLELALTMLDRAATTRDAETERRNVENGRKALQAVDALLARLDIEPGQREHVMRLRDELEQRVASFSG